MTKKKVLFITRHAIVNYGSFLQTYATQHIFEKLGLDCRVIDYIRDDEDYRNVTELLLSRSERWNANIFNRFIYRLVQWPDHFFPGRQFERLRQKYFRMTARISSADSEAATQLDADYYCTGSDQVWGEIGSDSFDSMYFLNFPRKSSSRSVALAASFGSQNYSDEVLDEYRQMLANYNCITVREQSAADIVNQCGYSADIILDPTMIVGRKFWEQSLIPVNKPKHYVLLYQLNSNQDMDQYAVKFAKKIKLPLLRVSVELHNIMKPGKFKWCLNPFEFLSYIHDADYMITDSFHGTVYAMLFERQFIEFLPVKKRTRNLNILKMFNLEDRIISDRNERCLTNTRINYSYVNDLVKDKQNAAWKLLKEMFI